ncbi:outer membrane beta-barrel protein [Hymenobacter properus]|uniref:Outer membrane beta-barrel protein n=1 Tax=Hymenobacter properus TaxID=2791026 RepID=A0A931FNL2_9BACT|nr:outer membrane beta-barrel protein [Hymenobacter properus]MBF9144271.1 outer membrane beta-barrel protein [Hymenobacter properus]MBR7723089.1 outer membrane beta-barrel protein [Microvirga sp. SRT04]
MQHLRPALSGLLLALPLLGRAQAAPDAAPAPRFYVGLAAYSSDYLPLESRHSGVSGFPVPLQLTAGYQLRPRLAVQVGLAYSGSAYGYNGEGYFYNLNSARGTYYSYSGKSTVRNTSASVLARYTLTRKAEHRLQFDALGGFTLVHRRGSDQGIYVDSLSGSRNTSPYDGHASTNTLLLTAGLGTRYRLSPRFDLTLDLLLNRSLASPLYYDNFFKNYQGGFSSSAALGVRYRFGRK